MNAAQRREARHTAEVTDLQADLDAAHERLAEAVAARAGTTALNAVLEQSVTELVEERNRLELERDIAQSTVDDLNQTVEALEHEVEQLKTLPAGSGVRCQMIARIDKWLAKCNQHHGTDAYLTLKFNARLDEWDDDDHPMASISVEETDHFDDIEGRL